MSGDDLLLCIIGILGGFIPSTVFYQISLQKRSLLYELNTSTIISNSVSEIEGLNVTYRNTPIQNLYITIVNIYNIGNTYIEKKDFTIKEPLALLTSGYFWGDSKQFVKLTSTNEHNTLSSEFKTKSYLEIYFDYIQRGERITCEVYHTGRIKLNAVLKNGKLREMTEYTGQKRRRKLKIIFCTEIVVLILIIFIYLMCSGISVY